MSDDQDLQRRHDWPEPAGETGSDATNIIQWPADRGTSRSQMDIVSFNRKELDLILRLYGFKVADGEWRDYAIDMLKDRAVFSVFRRTSEVPLHCIEKIPKLARKQGAYAVTGAGGRILKRGHDLATVLKIFEGKPKLRLV